MVEPMPSDDATFIVARCVDSSDDCSMCMPDIFYVNRILFETNVVQMLNHLELMFCECQRWEIKLSFRLLDHL